MTEGETLFKDTLRSDGDDEKLRMGTPPVNAGQCYCGRPRNLQTLELQCTACFRWFHSDCVSIYTGNCLPFITNYSFTCRGCSGSGIESLTRRQSSFTQMCVTAIANLILQHFSSGQKLFSKDRDIIPFIDHNWEFLTTVPRKSKSSWQESVKKVLHREDKVFSYKEEVSGDPHFGIVADDLAGISPTADLPTSEVLRGRGGSTTTSGSGSKRGKSETVTSNTSHLRSAAVDHSGVNGGSGVLTRACRNPSMNNETDSNGNSRAFGVSAANSSSGLALTANSLTSSSVEYPLNKDGYRYILAEPDPHSPHRQAWDEREETAGKPIPGCLYRPHLPTEVLLSLNDRAPQLRTSEDRLTVTGEKGYSTIRSNLGVSLGCWYYEVSVAEMTPPGAARIGWVHSTANLQAPVGYDKFGFGWRSRYGTVFTDSRGSHYAESGYAAGDVIGCLISLPLSMPLLGPAADYLPPNYKDLPLVKFRGNLYYEERDQATEAEKQLKRLPGAHIEFFRNGVSQGKAWKDIPYGTYYIGISLYKAVTVRVNPGPVFRYPPPKTLQLDGALESQEEDISAINATVHPMCDVAVNAAVLHSMGDILYHVENENNPPDFLSG